MTRALDIFNPWAVIEFAEERRTIEFDNYLKSGSGSAFAKRHFREPIASPYGLGIREC